MFSFCFAFLRFVSFIFAEQTPSPLLSIIVIATHATDTRSRAQWWYCCHRLMSDSAEIQVLMAMGSNGDNRMLNLKSTQLLQIIGKAELVRQVLNFHPGDGGALECVRWDAAAAAAVMPLFAFLKSACGMLN